MGNAAPRGHPIHRARTDGLLEAQTVAVDDLTLDHVCDRRQADVRVGAHIQAATRRKLARAQVIEKAKRPQMLACERGQNPRNGKAVHVARMPAQDRFQGARGRLVSHAREASIQVRVGREATRRRARMPSGGVPRFPVRSRPRPSGHACPPSPHFPGDFARFQPQPGTSPWFGARIGIGSPEPLPGSARNGIGVGMGGEGRELDGLGGAPPRSGHGLP